MSLYQQPTKRVADFRRFVRNKAPSSLWITKMRMLAQLCLLAVILTSSGCQESSDPAVAAAPVTTTILNETSAGFGRAEDFAAKPSNDSQPVEETKADPDNNVSVGNATVGDEDSPSEPNTQPAGDAEPKATDEGEAADEDEAKKPETEAPSAKGDAGEKQPAGKAPAKKSPYPRRVKMPELPRNADWINTRSLKMDDLKGKYVVFDFWTYCCINCIHILPELKKLEKKYPNDVVVIGVHAAKFDTEKDRDNISEAVLRYEIEHPVLVDSAHKFWNQIGVSSWPTVLVVDPEGYLVYGKPGEIKFEELERVIEFGIDYYRETKLLDSTPIRFDLLAHNQKPTPLRFPGKILADESGQRLFVTDSNHNRIVVSDLAGKVQQIIGSGKIGKSDGSFSECSFDHPQGLALHGQTLYVSDTENHLLRKVDLAKQTVTTIAGLGMQATTPWPGLEGLNSFDPQKKMRFVGKPMKTALNSPWALWVHEDALYIAMAGPHQIWKMPLDESEIGPFAGNAREDIVDGALLPEQPYGTDAPKGGPVSSFAQPSGLTSDGKVLFVADSEGSSIRAVPFDPNAKVTTLIGTNELPLGRLFDFGDVDGPRSKAKLQHCLGVAYQNGKVYAADTYNNKIKVVDARSGAVKTLAGDAKPGKSDDPPRFDEPAGIAVANGTVYIADTNNHLIRTLDLKSGKVATMKFEGLSPPQRGGLEKPNLSKAEQLTHKPAPLKAVDGKLTVKVKLKLPFGWKINELAPMRAWLQGSGKGPIANEKLGFVDLAKPSSEITLTVPVGKEGSDELTVYVPYFYCRSDGTGLCKTGELAWTIPIEVLNDGKTNAIELEHVIGLNPLAKPAP